MGVKYVSSSFSSFWYSYTMKLFPGWPHQQNLYEYCFSLLLVYLLTFTAEFCSKYPISPRWRYGEQRWLAVLSASALRGLKMFLTYLAIIAVMATDFVFLVAAVGGHAAGDFAADMCEYYIQEQEEPEEAKLFY